MEGLSMSSSLIMWSALQGMTIPELNDLLSSIKGDPLGVTVLNGHTYTNGDILSAVVQLIEEAWRP